MPGGITFGVAKQSLRLAVENGVSADDPRVMILTNEATQELLCARTPDGQQVVPVGSMATYDVVSSGETLLLPKELENGISFEVVNGGTQEGQTDVVRGWYSLVNNFAYVDPMMAHDNPVEDQFLQPDPGDPTVLRRQYRYRGLTGNATVRVTGRKRFIPITSDADYLIIQNIPALKEMLLALDRRAARNSPDEGEKHKQSAINILVGEAQNHLLDPQNLIARKGDYQKDLVTYGEGTLGRVRARLALELPNFLMLGKSEITYFLNEAVREAVDQYNFLGRTERYSADEGPNQIAYVLPTAPGDLLSFSNFEVLRLLVVAQRVAPVGVEPPPDASPAKQQAFNLIERDLAQTVEAARMAAHVAATYNFKVGSKGWMVGVIGTEVPGALNYPVKRLSELVERAEQRGMEMGIFKGMVEEFDAKVVRGHVMMPERVESILGASLCGEPVEVRSVFFKYLENGPGAWDYSCGGRIDDEGEVVLKDGMRRRRYFIHATGVSVPTAPVTTTTGGGTSSIPGVIDGIFYISTDSRIVALETGGVALEIFDGANWVRQSTWTE